MHKIDIKVGTRFGRLVFVKDVESIKRKSGTQRRSIFRCDCGTEKVFYTCDVRNQTSRSCGCLHKEQLSKFATIHGMSKTKIYRVWHAMMDRCYRKKDRGYKNYGGRGISVTKSWHKFKNFYADMGRTYKEGLQLDRINNNNGYSKKNCRWSTRSENCKNKRSSVIYKGEHSYDAAVRLGGTPRMIEQRIVKLGWSKKKAFTTPIIKN